LRILIAYFSQTGNTEKIARAIYQEVISKGHEVHLKRIDEITAEGLSDYDLNFIGSACHDADLAKPVKKVLEKIPQSPQFKLAGFVTHATHTPEGGERRRSLYEKWAGRCVESFERTSQEKGIDFLGYFSCQGAPSYPVEEFIHREIVPEKEEWEEYVSEVRKHPNEKDIENAKKFVRKILTESGTLTP
jgi:flavodoxin